MKARSLFLGAAATLALSMPAYAGMDGWYFSLEGGANWVEDWQHRQFTTSGGSPTSFFNAESSFDTGWAVLASVGHAFGGGFRGEFEAGYRDNDGDGFTISGTPVTTFSQDLTEVTLMLNLLYDIPLGERFKISLGAGAGADYAMLDQQVGATSFEDEHWSFAYQGIAGLNYAMGRQSELFVNYRYLRVTEAEFDFRPVTNAYIEGDDIVKHTVTLGLRYYFDRGEPEPMAAAPAPPPPEPSAAPREYIVFFGHNKSNLTAEAMDVIRQAAAAAKQYGSATLTVVGHADRSGSSRYNEGLSLRRANAVKGALVSEGIADSAISVSGKGESDPMVQTADGVREPQNRRVHITM
jgi:outer membrane protein OmpA-like peptidoglycan-associated protein